MQTVDKDATDLLIILVDALNEQILPDGGRVTPRIPQALIDLLLLIFCHCAKAISRKATRLRRIC